MITLKILLGYFDNCVSRVSSEWRHSIQNRSYSFRKIYFSLYEWIWKKKKEKRMIVISCICFPFFLYIFIILLIIVHMIIIKLIFNTHSMNYCCFLLYTSDSYYKFMALVLLFILFLKQDNLGISTIPSNPLLKIVFSLVLCIFL